MEENNFGEVLKKYRERLWPVIDKEIKSINIFPKYCQINKKYQKELDFHQEIISEYPRRKGKYLRPTLLILTALGMGEKIENILNTAAAMQISEDWILNHDDIEDDSPNRRGLPALHKIYGTELAINAGDALHMVMWKILFENYKEMEVKKAEKIFNEFYTMMNRTVLGQEIELKWTKENRFDLKDEDNFLVLESKTGYYTIAGPMRLGAILAGAKEDELKAIYKFGVLLGRSFQITDDILDLTSDFNGLKGIKGNDIYENKRTIMLLHLCREVKGKDRNTLMEVLNKKREEKNSMDVEKIINLMNGYGSLDYGAKMSKRFAIEAKKIFEKELSFIKKEPYRNQIKMAIDFIVNRNY